MIFSSGYQPIYCAFQSYCASLCHNYSRLFYYTLNISSLLFRLIFYPSVNLQSVQLNIGSDKLRSFRLIFGISCDCCAIRSKPGLTMCKYNHDFEGHIIYFTIMLITNILLRSNSFYELVAEIINNFIGHKKLEYALIDMLVLLSKYRDELHLPYYHIVRTPEITKLGYTYNFQ